MGKKVNPKILRMGIIKTWPSTWFSVGENYKRNTGQDVKVRRYLLKELIEAGVDKVEIGRSANKVEINIYTAKPGMIIGRGGTGIEDLKRKVHDKFLKKFRLREIILNIHEVDRPNLSAQIVVQSIILEIQKRMPYRKVMKQAIARVERAGALGVKVMIGGRLNGAEIARSERLVSGKVPLHILRADVDYARGVAHTTYGSIGIKVWIYRGDIFKQDQETKAGEVVGKKPTKLSR